MYRNFSASSPARFVSARPRLRHRLARHRSFSSGPEMFVRIPAPGTSAPNPDARRLRLPAPEPQIVVQVSFIEWTVHGKLRHPRLVGVRYDKSPREVVRETW